MAMTSLLKSQISGSIPASVSIAIKVSIAAAGYRRHNSVAHREARYVFTISFATRSFPTRGILVFTKTPNTPKTEWLFFTCISSAKESSGSAIDDMGFSTGVWAPFAFPEQSKNEPGPGRWKGQDASILAPDDIAAIILGVVLPCDTRLLEGDPVATSTFAESSSSAICKPGEKAACLVVNTDGFVLWGDSLDPLDAAMVGMLADPEAGAGIREVQLLPFFLVYVATTLPDFDAVRGWHRASKGAHAKLAKKYQNAVTESGSAEVLTRDLRKNWKIRARNMESEFLNGTGVSKRYIRCLQISKVVNSMKDFTDFHQEHDIGTIEDGNFLSDLLSKQDQKEWWIYLVKREPEVDTQKMEQEASKLSDLGPEVRSTVVKMMEGLSSDDGANRLHDFGPNKLEKKASCI